MTNKTTKHTSKKKNSPAANVERLEVKSKPISDRMLMWILGIFAFVLFSGTIKHGFVLDDIAVIENNVIVQKGFSGIPELFSTFYWEGYWEANAGLYRPMSLVSFAIEWAISPNNPSIHHFMNVLFYAITIGLLFKLLRRVFSNASPWVSFSIVLLFLCHPAHTEVVANIKSRDEIFCLLFFVLSFLALLREDTKPTRRVIVSSLLFLLCLLSKEGGIMFLPILGAYFLWMRGLPFFEVIKKLTPFTIVGVLWLILHQSVIHGSPNPPITYTYEDNSLVACAGKAEQLATGFSIFGKYVMSSLVPRNLSYDYSYGEIPCVTFASVNALLGIFLFTALIGGIFFLRKRKKEIAFGLTWFLMSILLVTNIFTLIGTTYADRLLFVPSLGIAIAVVFLIYQILPVKENNSAWNLSFALILVVSGLYSFQTVSRNKVWESNDTLFSEDVKHSTGSSRVHYNFGVQLLNGEGDTLVASTAAAKEFEIAAKIDPMDERAFMNLGVAYYRMGDYQKSIEASLNSLKLNPKDTLVMGNLADAYFKLNKYDDAIKYYAVFVQSPYCQPGHFERCGFIYVNRKEYDRAIAVFEKGIKQFPDFENLYMNLGNVYGMKNDLKRAIPIFKAAYEMNPSNREALRLMLVGYEMTRDQKNFEKYIQIYNATAPKK